MSEQELLRQYIEEGSNEAFAEIVRRHVNLVYSVAWRIVRSSAPAQDVTQSVFIALAQNAARLKAGTPLVAWLHLVSRRTAIDLVRREGRRQLRETQANAIAAMTSSPSEWSAIEPILDEAVDALGAADRTAILLRYFENKSLREVGDALGTSEDNAQKRVSRSLESLRKFFATRGIAVTASGLLTNLSAHATQIAPSALTTTLRAVSALTPALAPVSIVTSLAMTSLQKILLTLGAAASIGAVLYQGSMIVQQQKELADLRNQTAQLEAQNQALRNRVEIKPVANAARPPTPDPERLAAEAAIEAWVTRLTEFKRRVGEMKDRQIPEMQFLTDDDWVSAMHNADLASDLGIRKAMSGLRNSAKNHFISKLGFALSAYLEKNNNQLPADVALLSPYFNPPIDPAILARYEIVPNSADSRQFKDTPVREKAVVDDYYDTLVRGGTRANAVEGVSLVARSIGKSIQEYRSTHSGALPTADEIAPYLKSEIDPRYLKEVVDGYAGR